MSVPTPPQVNDLPRVGPTTIEFWWDPPLSDGGNPVTSYTLSCASPAFTFTIPAPQNYYLVSGLTTGVSYAFTITADNINGSSPPAAFRTVICGDFPSPPQNVSIAFTALSTGTAKVTWNTPLSDGGATVKYYAVEAQPQYPQYVSTVTYGTPATQLQRYCSGLTPNQNYNFLVNSINDPGWSLLPSTSGYALFSPLNVANLFLWFDGADPTSYTIDGTYNTVQTWTSKTTPSYSVVSPGVTVAPSISPSEFGIFPGVAFLVSNPYNQPSYMFDLSTIPSIAGNGPFTAFTVVRQLTNGTARGICSTYSPSFTGSFTLFWETNNTFTLVVNSASVALTPSTINTNTLLTVSYETTEIGGATNFGLTFNGNDFITTTHGGTLTTGGFVLGNFGEYTPGPGPFAIPDNGLIAELILVQNDPSQATRQKIEGYLAWKYNMASELPPTHPYYNSPPLPPAPPS